MTGRDLERHAGQDPVPVRAERSHGRRHTYTTARPAGELDPEWVMVGVDVPAGKRLYASRDLKGSAFTVAMNEYASGDGWHLTTTMCRMLVITRPTYGECLAELIRIWNNWDANDRGLPPGSGARPAAGALPR